MSVPAPQVVSPKWRPEVLNPEPLNEEPDMAKARRVAASHVEEEVVSHYAVSLPNNRTAVVEASNEDEAFRKYKEVMGIRSSDHEPKIGPCDPNDFVLDEHGIESVIGRVTSEDESDDGES